MIILALSSEAKARLLNLLGTLQSLPTTATSTTTTTTNVTDLLNTANSSTNVTELLSTLNTNGLVDTSLITNLLNTTTTNVTDLLNTTTTSATNLLNTTTATATGLLNTTTTATTNLLIDLLRLRLLPSLNALRNDLTNRLNQTVQLSTEYETLTGVLLAVLSDYVVLVESDGTMHFVNLSKIETVASL
ncbi:DUF2642 domain-containing protein [Priestia megaterium]|jgi:hypothetical protein|uniref:DUF2642 domain-containing protein n=1 Tax=Priestia megaterium TaxID=1404 RepID=UPI0020B3F32D|nr:DUF2642 domain-containing protein [Priestia megaterium]